MSAKLGFPKYLNFQQTFRADFAIGSSDIAQAGGHGMADATDEEGIRGFANVFVAFAPGTPIHPGDPG
jgi:hypothetical protein